MSWSEKVSSKKYLLGTVINLAFAIYAGWPSLQTSFWLSVLVVSIALNHFFTIRVFMQLFQSQLTGVKRSKKKLALDFFFKVFFLFGGFGCFLYFGRDKVLHGMASYLFQLIILFLSIKNIGQFIKKGSPP